jgi:hypothetical protein
MVMNEHMRILIAYDGSSYADAALDDLRWAGLPREAEALLLTVVDVGLRLPSCEESDASPAARLGIIGLHRARQQIARPWKKHGHWQCRWVSVCVRTSQAGVCVLKQTPIHRLLRSSAWRTNGQRI